MVVPTDMWERRDQCHGDTVWYTACGLLIIYWFQCIYLWSIAHCCPYLRPSNGQNIEEVEGSNVPYSRECIGLRSVGYSPFTLTTTVRRKHIDPVENISIYHWMTYLFFNADWLQFVRSFYCSNKPKERFMYRSNQTEHKCIVSHAHNMTVLQPNVFLTLIQPLLTL